jgi:hypothetical protein
MGGIQGDKKEIRHTGSLTGLNGRGATVSLWQVSRTDISTGNQSKRGVSSVGQLNETDL